MLGFALERFPLERLFSQTRGREIVCWRQTIWEAHKRKIVYLERFPSKTHKWRIVYEVNNYVNN